MPGILPLIINSRKCVEKSTELLGAFKVLLGAVQLVFLCVSYGTVKVRLIRPLVIRTVL